MAIEKKCVIITGLIEGFGDWVYDVCNGAYVICADGGYAFAKVLELKVDLLIGDFDSYDGELPDEDLVEIIRLDTEKDDTDTAICIKEAIARGFKNITIVGGIGGRLSHTIANIQSMADMSAGVDKIDQIDGERHCYFLNGPASIELRKPEEDLNGHEKNKDYISLFSHSDFCSGVTAKGVYYPLDNTTLNCNYPIGCSNEMVDAFVNISVKKGTLVVVVE